MLEKIRSFFAGDDNHGVRKYLKNKTVAGIGSALLLIAICVLVGVGTSVSTESCARSSTTGTWVLREDYYNGFDPDDMYVEFRDDGSFHVRGSHKGYLVIDGQKRGISVFPDMTYLSSNADKVRLENKLLIIEAKSNDMYEMESADAWRLQVYVHISGDCELTPEQRAELY